MIVDLIIRRRLGLPSNLPSRPGYYDLQGMLERIEGLGGILTVGGNGQAGTVIEASQPLIRSSEYPGEDLMSYGHNSHSAFRGSNANVAGPENDPSANIARRYGLTS